MSQSQLLRDVVRALESAGIEYMLTGSLVSSLQGEPRATHDIDFVVSIAGEAVEGLTASFREPDYFLDPMSVRDAVETRSTFNLIDLRSGDKVDFWLLTDEPFDRSRFQRRVPQDVLGIGVAVSRPEDTILQKLHWVRLSGGSEKQFRDALRVYEVQAEILNRDYLRSWAERLGVGDLLTRVEAEAEPI